MRPCAVATMIVLAGFPVACVAPADDPGAEAGEAGDVATRLARYTEVTLSPDLSVLSDAERAMLSPLMRAADAVNQIYWMQAYGDQDALFSSVDDPDTRRLLEINFGPWDRLDGNAPFVDGVAAKPPGANFYPTDVTREEIEAADDEDLRSLYTLVRRDDSGTLRAVPYREAFADQVQVIAAALREAASLAEDDGLRRYLELRAEAILTDEYQASDLAWMEMKDNTIDVVIGPIETYEDQLLGAKAAHEAVVLIKDREWSERLERYAGLLPSLQATLPVPDAYRAEEPGTEAELNAYDLVYIAGDGNAGSKSIAINLPNDEQVQLQRGTRRIQIKNSMRAKFDAILAPIADELIAAEQRGHVTFDAFFANTMFHEVAHGLGIKNTLDGSGTVRSALQEHASWVEEGKADILGLHMIGELHARGELGDVDLMDNYVTFCASIFRSIRFGSTSAHGRANLVRFNYFRDQGVLDFDAGTRTYRIDIDRLRDAISGLSSLLLTMQGDGDRAGAEALWESSGIIGDGLQGALDRLAGRSIPVDIVYRQGKDVLALD